MCRQARSPAFSRRCEVPDSRAPPPESRQATTGRLVFWTDALVALMLDNSEMNNLLILQALRPVADCEPTAFTFPVTAFDFLCAAEHRDADTGHHIAC